MNKNIWLKSTSENTRLYYSNYGKELNLAYYLSKFSTGQHLYVTSDENFKKKDWVLYCNPNNNRTFVVKCSEISNTWFDFERKTLDARQIPIEWGKKIILTNDLILTQDNIQKFDDEFLEWFVNNPNCEQIETVYGKFNPMGRQVDPMNMGENQSQCVWKYKIIIPEKRPAALAIIKNSENKILFLKRNFLPYGLGLPGGKSEKNESIWETLQREVLEETNLEVTWFKLPFKESSSFDGREITIIECQCKDDNVVLSKEHSEFYWLSEEEYKNYNFAGNTLKFLKL